MRQLSQAPQGVQRKWDASEQDNLTGLSEAHVQLIRRYQHLPVGRAAADTDVYRAVDQENPQKGSPQGSCRRPKTTAV